MTLRHHLSLSWAGSVVIGLLAIGGSAIRDHVLDIARAMKISREAAIPK